MYLLGKDLRRGGSEEAGGRRCRIVRRIGRGVLVVWKVLEIAW